MEMTNKKGGQNIPPRHSILYLCPSSAISAILNRRTQGRIPLIPLWMRIIVSS